jgi:hypothetical protein
LIMEYDTDKKGTIEFPNVLKMVTELRDKEYFDEISSWLIENGEPVQVDDLMHILRLNMRDKDIYEIFIGTRMDEKINYKSFLEMKKYCVVDLTKL